MGSKWSKIAQFVVVITWVGVQYGIYFSRLFILHEPEGRVQYIKSRKIYNILHEKPM